MNRGPNPMVFVWFMLALAFFLIFSASCTAMSAPY